MKLVTLSLVLFFRYFVAAWRDDPPVVVDECEIDVEGPSPANRAGLLPPRMLRILIPPMWLDVPFADGVALVRC